jgi:hypothetical protein
MNMSECPRHISEVDAAGDPRVLIDVVRIIIVNEVVSERLTKNDPHKRKKRNADAESQPAPVQLIRVYRLNTQVVHVWHSEQ